MAVTIKDVAQLAEVAPSTVSRVISNSPSISQPTKERVRQAMEKLNYHPNINARNLVSKESKTIGLVLPTASDQFYQNPFFPTVLRGINEAASLEGFSLLLTTGSLIEDRKAHVEQMVYGKQVDGLIFLYSTAHDPLMQFVASINFPYVVIGTPNTNQANYVDNDNYHSAYRAADYLIHHQASRIAFIGGHLEQPFIKERQSGVKQALEDNNITFSEADFYNENSLTAKDGYNIGKDFIVDQQYDAVIIAEESFARGFKLAIAGFPEERLKTMTFQAYGSSDDTIAESGHYIDLRTQKLGQVAVEILFDVLKNKRENNQSQRFIHEIVEAKLIV